MAAAEAASRPDATEPDPSAASAADAPTCAAVRHGGKLARRATGNPAPVAAGWWTIAENLPE
jgi:hypothetical protein